MNTPFRATAFPRSITIPRLAFALAWAGLLPNGLALESRAEICRYYSTAFVPAPQESATYRKYSPDKQIEIQHLALDVTPDFAKRSIRGKANLKFKAIAIPLEELRLDAVNLSIISTASSEPGYKQQATDKEIVFTFSPPVPVGREASVTIEYTAEPAKGLYFRTEAMGYEATHLWTQGETTESRHWFPSFDHPVQKFTSEVTCRVPSGMTVLSNGRQVSSETGADGLTAVRWLQDKPHTNYLITLVAGRLAKIESKHRDVPLEFWTTPGEIANAQNSFRHTGRIMDFIERETGIPYPWAKYGQVAVHDFHWGGMENTSLTTLNHRTLFAAETENLFSSDSLVAHELAHQWFGDLVTCRDWNHVWLNEGFATYYDWLWQGDFYGREEMRQALFDSARGILANTNETRGVVWRKYNEPGELFSYHVYPKGAWVLHMLRSQLGAELYRKCIHTYLQRYQFASATTEQLQAVIEELSGRSFDRFFDQWVMGVGAPVLDVAYSWDEKTNLAKLSVKQTQKISEEAHLFQFPLKVRFTANGEALDRTVQVREKEEEFYFPLKAVPEVVRVDPDIELLAKINFKPARAMLLNQLADKSDAIGQLRALEALSEKPDAEAITKIQSVLQSAPHHGVREKAADVLRQAHTPEAFAALNASLSQSDARVRNAVVKALGGWFTPEASESLQKFAATEKNPGILASVLRALAPYQTPAVREIFTRSLETASFRERLAEGAINAIKAQDDPALLPPLLGAIRGRLAKLQPGPLPVALETAGSLARNEQNKDDVRALLLTHLQHPRESVRLAAISALGNLEDPRSISALETFSGASAYKPEKGAAEKALEKIRAARRPSEELKGLRNEVTELQKSATELKKELETLKKKLEPQKR